MNRIVPWAAVLLAFPAAVSAGTSGKIAGTVRDAQTGEALIGVSVVVEGTSMGAATNVDGYYVILNVSPGKYSLAASGVGYVRKTIKDVSISIDLTTTVDFTLASTVLNVGEEVVVTAERRGLKKDLTSSEARVDAQQIQAIPVKEVSEVLSLQAGVTVDRGGGIHIRGGRSNEVAYWVDGVSISDVYDGSQAVQVDNNAVQELQVVSGTFNAEYGQAMSGIVNIVTKDGDQTYRGSISAYSGSYLSRDDIFYNLGKTRPFDNRDIEGSISGPIPGMSGVTFYASGRYFKSNGWLYGNRTFTTNGAMVPGPDSITDASGALYGVTLGSNPVPMNDRTRMSGQAKLTFALSGTIKLALTGIISNIDYHDYDHAWFLVPDGIPEKHDRGYDLSLLWTHSASATSFYTVNLSYFLKRFREHLYEDPFDPRYNLDPGSQNTGIDEWIRAGTNLHQFKRNTESRVAKFDYTNQIDRLHQLKGGFEVKLHRLYLEDYYITPESDTTRVNGILTNFYKATIPDPTGPNYQEYTRTPVEASAYLQDKLEYEHMIVNIGVRFDYFNSRGQVLNDLQDPNVYLPQVPANIADSLLADRLGRWYHNAKAKTSISPRLGISYPITDRGILHFSYGHFFQIPSFQNLYQNPGYKVNETTPIQGVYGNPDLKPQRTTIYELGLQQQLTDALTFDVTGFYRDTRDWVGTSAQIPVRDPSGQTATVFYTMFVNKDYANTRGVTISLNQRQLGLLSFNFSYTFQVAEGNNSNPDEEQSALINNNEPSRTLTPLDWDQTHTANLTLGVGEQSWGAFFIARYGSGLPYTPSVNQAESRGQDAARVVQKNSRRQPDTYSIDVRLFKNVSLGGLELSFFLKVFNLLDQRNAVTVYGETGSPSATVEQLGLAGVGTGVGRVNTIDQYIVRPDYYSEPRQFQVGVDVNF